MVCKSLYTVQAESKENNGEADLLFNLQVLNLIFMDNHYESRGYIHNQGSK